MTPPSGQHFAGKIVFCELATPDLDAAEHFYSGLFGWSFSPTMFGRTMYAQATLGGHSVAGLVQEPLPPGRHPNWLPFISTQNVDQTVAIAEKDGAKLLFGPRDIVNFGREAVLADPQGAVFATLASSSGDPADELAAPGDWIWSALFAADPDTDAAFYQTLFGYEVFDAGSSNGREHLILASDDYARASDNPLPSSHPDARPGWLGFVRVEDAAASVTRATALGGHVLLAPRMDRHGSLIAIVADPSGAAVGLMEWPELGPARSREMSASRTPWAGLALLAAMGGLAAGCVATGPVEGGYPGPGYYDSSAFAIGSFGPGYDVGPYRQGYIRPSYHPEPGLRPGPRPFHGPPHGHGIPYIPGSHGPDGGPHGPGGGGFGGRGPGSGHGGGPGGGGPGGHR